MKTDHLAEIRARIDIVDLISEYLQLRRSGNNYRALCPFHNEKKPSFNVNRPKQIFHCFGCKKGGDIFSFLMLHDGLSFWEAVRVLAERAGVSLPSRKGEPAGTGAIRKEIARLNGFAASHFRSNLAKSERARRYLADRQMSEALRERFGLGYAADAWTGLYNAAKSAGFSDEMLAQAGLARRRESGDGYYDLFRDRVMFPITDASGRVVGFGGRTLSDTEDVKYINSPESPLYHKGGSLYGLYQAKEAMRQPGTAYVVEGYFDLIMVAGAGVDNVVASLGTALTEEQARLLRRYVSRVVLIYDTDDAGIKAALRGVEVLLSCNLVPRLVRLPSGKDPDDFIRSSGAEKFRDTLEEQSDFLDFLISAHELDRTDVEGRTAVAQRGFALVEKVKNELKRSEYLKLLAEKLDLSEKAVRAEFARGLRKGRREPEQPRPKLGEVESDLLRLLIERADLLEEARGSLDLQDLSPGAMKELVEMLFRASAESDDVGQFLMDSAADPGTKEMLASVLIRETNMESGEKAVADWIASVKRCAKQRKAEDLQKQIRVAERAGDTSGLITLLKQKEELVS
jgi:DNA primase